jgi:hypothetical protein
MLSQHAHAVNEKQAPGMFAGNWRYRFTVLSTIFCAIILWPLALLEKFAIDSSVFVLFLAIFPLFVGLHSSIVLIMPRGDRRGLVLEILWTTFVFLLIAGAIAFGSGALLERITGINFFLADSIITLASPPLIFLLIEYSRSRPGILARRFQEKMRLEGRFRSWAEVLPDLQAGTGTLIVEIINHGLRFGPVWRVWWTPDSVLDIAPASHAIDVSECKLGENAFVDWCYGRYLREQKGSAVLTDCDIEPETDFIFLPDLGSKGDQFRKKFPDLAVVVLPLILH